MVDLTKAEFGTLDTTSNLGSQLSIKTLRAGSLKKKKAKSG